METFTKMGVERKKSNPKCAQMLFDRRFRYPKISQAVRIEKNKMDNFGNDVFTKVQRNHVVEGHIHGKVRGDGRWVASTLTIAFLIPLGIL